MLAGPSPHESDFGTPAPHAHFLPPVDAAGAWQPHMTADVASVLQEFGFRISPDGRSEPGLARRERPVGGAELVVCALLRHGAELPEEAALAVRWQIPVIALVAAGVPVTGTAAVLLSDAMVLHFGSSGAPDALHRALRDLLPEEVPDLPGLYADLDADVVESTCLFCGSSVLATPGSSSWDRCHNCAY